MDMDLVLPTSGPLKKWTNYVNGWQDRYFEIKNGSFMYYRTKADKSFGCRGSLALKSVNITSHEFNECEFTVSVGSDLVWYLKAENPRSAQLWIKSLSRDGNDSDYSSTSTKSHSRNESVSSMVFGGDKNEGSANDSDGEKLFVSRVAELEAYRAICCEQMNSIQRMLKKQGDVGEQKQLEVKAIHTAMIANLNHIIELVKSGKASLPESPASSSRRIFIPLTPATPEPPTPLPLDPEPTPSESTTIHEPPSISTIDVTSECGDEWHDADEHSSMGSVDSGEEALEKRTNSALSSRGSSLSPQPPTVGQQEEKKKAEIVVKPVERKLPFGHYDNIELPEKDRYYNDVHSLATEQLKYALAGVEDNVWTKFAEDGAMRMYTREVTDGGLPVDPLKATHQVQGVTALEFMHYFFDAKYKKDWDHTLDSMSIVEQMSRDAVILHQKHKTVWPAAPRESLFVSHIRRADDLKNPEAHDLYIVCNKDVVRSDVPLGSSSSVRVGLTVSMVCETIIKGNKPIDELTRDDVLCNIIYVSQVHPGGWVPVSALRHVYKKEYPKFLRTFTEFVLKNVKGKPVAI